MMTVIRALRSWMLGPVLCGVMSLGVLAGAATADEYEINMVDADINAFINDVSQITGYTFIKHPAVRGTVNVTSPVPLTKDEVFEIFMATMRTSDYAVVSAGPGKFRVVPDDAAKTEQTIIGSGGAFADQFVTQVFPLNHVDVQEAAQTVLPLVNGRGQITASASANRLVVVDYSSNIERIGAVLADLDKDTSISEWIKLENMAASEVAQMITTLSSSAGRGGRQTSTGVNAFAMASGNTVVVRGDRADVLRTATLVRELDAASMPTESLRVVYLKHADAEEMVNILQPLAQSMERPGEAGTQQNQLTIPFHAPTNALVLSMDPQRLAAMVRVIEALDIRREEVLVEAIIVEVSDEAAKELGLQFILSGTEENATTPFAVSNFSRSTPSLLSIAGAVIGGIDSSDTLQTQAVNSLLGIDGLAIGVGGESSGTLFGAILNAVDTDAASNLLSTPSVKVLDNETARFVVGQEVPVSTGQTLSDDFSNVFNSISREDVGIELEVTPTINEGDLVRLEIRQEASSVASTASASGELVFNTREIETVVLAENNEVIVLGGLIELAESESASRVPLLGSIPVAGRLFRSEGTSRTKTNLVVFIRPTIIRSRDDNQAVTSRRFDIAREQMLSVGSDLDAMLGEALGEPLVVDVPASGSGPVSGTVTAE